MYDAEAVGDRRLRTQIGYEARGTDSKYTTFRKEEQSMILTASTRQRRQAHVSGAFLNLKSQCLL